ncbi:hypothetical protein [Butyrivibrio proteoclasticus]|uniref:hypothetical protein n=1 Tax=Butyrivibrio proteoclasticus TaxID=43305 RepID=UPI0005577871|nr:hypothetical protein [Butyrivibrio proteoclasticus]
MAKTLNILSSSELKIKGDEALIDALGVVGFARYIEEYDKGGSGDYTKERDSLPSLNKSIDEISKTKPEF